MPEETYINIKLQDGPVGEVGVNGCQIDDVIEWARHALAVFNTAPYACRENSLALTKLEEAQMWLKRRTENRTARGVEGTSTP